MCFGYEMKQLQNKDSQQDSQHEALFTFKAPNNAMHWTVFIAQLA